MEGGSLNVRDARVDLRGRSPRDVRQVGFVSFVRHPEDMRAITRRNISPPIRDISVIVSRQKSAFRKSPIALWPRRSACRGRNFN